MAYNKKLMQSYQGKPCICCGTEIGTVAHHVKSIGAGGTDDPFNIMVLCGPTHALIHTSGLIAVSKANKSIYAWLKDNNWLQSPYSDKWVRYASNDIKF